MILARKLARESPTGEVQASAISLLVDSFVERQNGRMARRLLDGHEVGAFELMPLTWGDTIGPRPSFEHSPAMAKLASMTGLRAVKEACQGLVELATRNYDRVLEGRPPAQISLHRIFYGNPGTGKTTVARIYGELLKELGLLSDGSFVSCTPSDLTGAVVGASAQNTKNMIEKSKGKVLFIDEAYVLDPKRAAGSTAQGSFGGDVLDTLVEKLDGSAGSDIAVVLAG
eukprot:3938108-Rhodomonas_salina.2